MRGLFARVVTVALRGGVAAFALALCIHGSTKRAARNAAQLNPMGHRRSDVWQNSRTGQRLFAAKQGSGAGASEVLQSPAPSGDFGCPISRRAVTS